jgi:hypothetical protein
MKLIFIQLIIYGINGHGYMSKPQAIYIDPSTQTSYIQRVDGNTIFPGEKWDDSPERNTNQLISHSEFPELKTFFSKYINGCPINDLSKIINVDNVYTFEWQNDQEKQGFVSSHEGPCEIWIDDRKIFNDNNCAKHFNTYPAVINIDYSVCKGTCQFEFYWITMQEALWQLYKGCATISRSSTPTISAIPSTSSTPIIKLICSEV